MSGKESRKRKRSSNKPKKALTAYMLFCKDNREKVKNDNPGVSFGQAGKLLGEKWKVSSKEERDKYEAMAAEEKITHQKLMADYYEQHPNSSEDEAAGKKKRKAKRDPSEPKPPMSAFLLFSKRERQIVKDEKPDMSFGEVGKTVGARWRDLSESDKKTYIDQAKDDKARYEREKSEWSLKHRVSQPKVSDAEESDDHSSMNESGSDDEDSSSSEN